MIIGLGHSSRVGKDLVGELLVREFASRNVFVAKRAFAEKLKSAAFTIFSCYGLRGQGYYDSKKNQAKRYEVLPGINRTPVDLWIDLGMKVREIYADAWVDAVLKDSWTMGNYEHMIITDVRFQNEFDAIKAAGGSCVKVTRPGQIAQRSDNEFPEDHPWDHVIVNDGTIDELRIKVEELVGALWWD